MYSVIHPQNMVSIPSTSHLNSSRIDAVTPAILIGEPIVIGTRVYNEKFDYTIPYAQIIKGRIRKKKKIPLLPYKSSSIHELNLLRQSLRLGESLERQARIAYAHLQSNLPRNLVHKARKLGNRLHRRVSYGINNLSWRHQ